MKQNKLRYGFFSSIIARTLVTIRMSIPQFLFLFLTQSFFRILSLLEKFWFLYYAKKSHNNHEEILNKIRDNLFCPQTVITIYQFWVKNPNHEAFCGMTKVPF